MENRDEIRLEISSRNCGRKGEIPYLSILAAERGKSLSVKSGRKALYMVVATTAADAPFCRIGPESLPYPRKKCITVSPCLSAKKNRKEKKEAMA